MNSIKKIFLMFTFLWINLSAQDWVDINPSFSQSFNYLIMGSFIDKYEGWMIDWGQTKLFHTDSSGLTWTVLFDGPDSYFYDILYIDKRNGWAKIYNGIPFDNPYVPSLWKTTDGGMTWQEASTPSAFSIFTFIDSSTGFSGGDTKFFRTTDSGNSWHQSEIDSNYLFYIWDIFMIDTLFGWAVGSNSLVWDAGIILNTIDGGESWQVNVPVTMEGRAIYFTDRRHGFIVGSNPPVFEGVVMKTDDGGGHWAIQYLPGTWLRDVVFTSDSIGWAVGDVGMIWKTEDAGRTWNFVESNTYADLNRIVFVENGRIGFIFGDNGTLLRYESISNNVVERKWDETPINFKLSPNYPNPFNCETAIEYELPEAGQVCLRIVNLTGEEVKALENGRQPMGRHVVKWNGRDETGKEVASGVYLCLLESSVFSRAQKIVLNR